jgi:hypothetical protein
LKFFDEIILKTQIRRWDDDLNYDANVYSTEKGVPLPLMSLYSPHTYSGGRRGGGYY